MVCCVSFWLKPIFAEDPSTPKNVACFKSDQYLPLKKRNFVWRFTVITLFLPQFHLQLKNYVNVAGKNCLQFKNCLNWTWNSIEATYTTATTYVLLWNIFKKENFLCFVAREREEKIVVSICSRVSLKQKKKKQCWPKSSKITFFWCHSF